MISVGVSAALLKLGREFPVPKILCLRLDYMFLIKMNHETFYQYES